MNGIPYRTILYDISRAIYSSQAFEPVRAVVDQVGT